MLRNIMFFSVCSLLLVTSGCAGFQTGAFVSLNPIGLVCGTTLTIKDGDMYRYLSDEQVETIGNVTTYVVKPISTTGRRVALGVRPSPPYGMYVLRVEYRTMPQEHWKQARHHTRGQNPYQFAIGRKAMGNFQVEVKIVYRNAVAIPLEKEGTMVVESEPPDNKVVTSDDRIDRYLIPIKFARDLCDL